MREKIDYANIPKDEFSFVDRSGDIHDKKFDTKPIGYFKDVWLRFCRNKSSVVAAVIILILVLYAMRKNRLQYKFKPYIWQVGGKFVFPADQDKMEYCYPRGFDNCFTVEPNLPYPSFL